MLSRLLWTPKPDSGPPPLEPWRKRLRNSLAVWEAKQPAPKSAGQPVRKINKDRRRHLVDKVAAILKAHNEPTLFSLAATCRHAIRGRLCLDGCGWSEADAIAGDIVLAALNRCGARLPSWSEGQPEYAQNGAGAMILRTRCVRCRRSLPETSRKFCSDLCANAHFQVQYRVQHAAETAAYDMVVNPGSKRQWL